MARRWWILFIHTSIGSIVFFARIEAKCLKHNHFLLFLENYYQGHSLLLTETIPTDIMKLILICAATWWFGMFIVLGYMYLLYDPSQGILLQQLHLISRIMNLCRRCGRD